MKMKLPLLCRNTRAATEMAVNLTRLSKVELFCARNWGKPQIKHLIREARVELSRQAVSIDGVNWVYDTIPQDALPQQPLSSFVRYANLDVIENNTITQTTIAGGWCMYPRLRYCCRRGISALDTENAQTGIPCRARLLVGSHENQQRRDRNGDRVRGLPSRCKAVKKKRNKNA